jgi:hypothetical protein
LAALAGSVSNAANKGKQAKPASKERTKKIVLKNNFSRSIISHQSKQPCKGKRSIVAKNSAI